MGCGNSNPIDTSIPPRVDYSNHVFRSTCLIFGLLDGGQEIFIKALQNAFQRIGTNQAPYDLIEINPSRSARTTWLDEFSNYPSVVASFFFADIETEARTFLSLKTYNWFRAQCVDNSPPQLVARVTTPEEMEHFTILKSHLAPGVDIYTFNENLSSDISKYVEYITSCTAKKTHSVFQVPSPQKENSLLSI